MKKFIIVSLIILMCCAPICACSADYSEKIDEKMDDIYNSLYDALEMFFKKPEPKPEVGTSVGNRLPSYSVQIFDENGVKDETIDPSSLGKVTVINFWGTWCPPCVGELPEFSEVATEYKDSVTIVAIHSVQNFTEKAVSHIQDNFADSDIIFAMDENNGEGIAYRDECYETFGGSIYYPYTIILDQNGVITYAKEGALSKSQLIEKIEIALGN